jgi:hypothetical protein
MYNYKNSKSISKNLKSAIFTQIRILPTLPNFYFAELQEGIAQTTQRTIVRMQGTEKQNFSFGTEDVRIGRLQLISYALILLRFTATVTAVIIAAI